MGNLTVLRVSVYVRGSSTAEFDTFVFTADRKQQHPFVCTFLMQKDGFTKTGSQQPQGSVN
jgi:hypothetical protein